MTSAQAPLATKGYVLSVVERGWAGARRCSLDLHLHNIHVIHLIKGKLAPEVIGMIQPYPRIRLCSVSRRLFKVWLWALLATRMFRPRLRWLLIDHERTLRQVRWWCRLMGIVPILIKETPDDYKLYLNSKVVSLNEAFLGNSP